MFQRRPTISCYGWMCDILKQKLTLYFKQLKYMTLCAKRLCQTGPNKSLKHKSSFSLKRGTVGTEEGEVWGGGVTLANGGGVWGVAVPPPQIIFGLFILK